MRIDVRNTEPPQPMIRVVQVLEKLQEGDVLEVLGSRPFTHSHTARQGNQNKFHGSITLFSHWKLAVRGVRCVGMLLFRKL